MKDVVTWLRESDEEPFRKVFDAYPGIRLWNARTEKVPGESAGLLLTGGSDISAEFLRQPIPDPALIEHPDVARDQWEFSALERALAARVPLLAICRGHQVLNVALGGTLHLHIPGHANPADRFSEVQPLRYLPGTPIQFAKVNSSHHQALDRLGAGLVVDAWHAEDGTIEQAHLRDYPFGFAAQYHPERGAQYRPLFDAFAAAVEGR